jgi:hypothetical protein
VQGELIAPVRYRILNNVYLIHSIKKHFPSELNVFMIDLMIEVLKMFKSLIIFPMTLQHTFLYPLPLI